MENIDINDYINNYNNKLVESNKEISIVDYCKELHNKFYSNIDISFIDKLLSFVLACFASSHKFK